MVLRLSSQRFLMLLETMTEAREAEALREQIHTSYGAWQLGRLLAGSEHYPSFRDYLKSLGLVD